MKVSARPEYKWHGQWHQERKWNSCPNFGFFMNKCKNPENSSLKIKENSIIW